MVVKTLQVFYGADLLPYKDQERKIHFPIVGPAFQGSSQANEIKFYIDDIGGSSLQWVACAKLPNGKIGFKILDTISDDYGTYALLTLDKWFTQVKGDLYISLKGYDGGVQLEYDSETELYSIEGEEVIQSTGSIKMTIQYATPIVEGEDFGDITIQELLALVSTKVGKSENVYLKVVSSISDINTSTYEDYLKSGDIIYDKQQSNIYVLSGTYPTLSSTLILSFGQIVLTTGDQSIYGIKTFTGSKTYVNNLVSGIDEELATYHYARINQEGLTISKTINNANHYFNLRDYNGNWVFRFGEGSNSYYLTIPIEEGTIATKEYADAFGKSIALSIDSNYVLTLSLKDANNNVLSTQAIDLPLESVVVNGSYDDTTKSIILTLENGNTITIPVGDLISGLVNSTTTIAGVQIGSGISAQDLYSGLFDITEVTIDEN